MVDELPLESEQGQQVVEMEAPQVEVPRRYKVLLHNDDYTTMEFVVMILQTVFYHSEAKAVQIMLQIHQTGVGVAGCFSFEVAESKCHKVMALAKNHAYPLRCSMEAEE